MFALEAAENANGEGSALIGATAAAAAVKKRAEEKMDASGVSVGLAQAAWGLILRTMQPVSGLFKEASTPPPQQCLLSSTGLALLLSWLDSTARRRLLKIVNVCTAGTTTTRSL